MTDLQYTHPRKYGPGAYACRLCNSQRGVIRKYNLMLCRRCFRENAKDIGFVKVRRLNPCRCSVELVLTIAASCQLLCTVLSKNFMLLRLAQLQCASVG